MGCCSSKQKSSKDNPNPSPVPNDNQAVTPPPNKPQVVSRKEKSVKGVKESANVGQNVNTKTEDSEETKKAIDDERLEKEFKTSAKGGESAYGKTKAVQREPKKKALSASNYNTQGLVDKKSKEFGIVRDYLLTKNYQLNESIGSGNYAEVYKASIPERNRFVAVKVIDLSKTNDNYRLSFLPREISILSKLKHPGIVKHYEVTQSMSRVFMIMEFCGKGTVTDWLRDRGPFTEPLAWEMDTRILEGLHYMHSNRIAHRDLKLENILINDQNYPKLSDFSYAVVVDEAETKSETFCGSLPYFGPEILQRKPHNPLVSDIWGLGVCFYVMVCDGLPFKIDDDKQMLNKQLEKDWDFKKKVRNKLSNEFKQMIRDMLDPDVNTRATTQQLMNHIWIKNKP